MPENIDHKTTLLSMASFKGEMKRDGVADAKTRLSVANATKKSSFDGFLNTFLGRDQDTGKPKKTGPGSSPGSGLKPSDKESLQKSMDKTVAAEAAEGELSDEEVAAAAEEAAVLIWNLLYGYGGEGGAMPGSVPDSLRQLAGMLHANGSLSGQPGLDPAAVQGAVETANACAEMNSSAILASVDALLEGMPRQALDDALTRMAGQMGIPVNGGFEGVLAMLKGEITSVNAMSNANLFGMLSASGTMTNPALTAENAGESAETATLDELLDEFMAEKKDSLTGDEDVEDVAKDFADWLKNERKSKSVKMLSADAENFLASSFGKEDEKKQAFSEIIKNLENSLQQNFQQSAQTAAPQQPGQTANAQNAHTTTMTNMLEQMENIERLSEAMKMATKGGVNNITMQLAPAELGRLVLKVESRNGVVSAKLRVEKKEAAEQLGANLHQLKESLRALGIELGEVDIEHDAPSGDAPQEFLNELDGLKYLFA